MCFEGLARLSRRVWRRFVRGSREISLVPSLHRASTDALMQIVLILMGVTHAPALQDTLEMGMSALVRIALYNFNALKFNTL